MSFQESRLDEREAASIVAGLHSHIADTPLAASVAAAGTKRGVRDDDDNDDDDDDDDDDDIDGTNDEDDMKRSRKKPAIAAKSKAKRKDPPMDATGLVFAQPELKPAPYFYYSDHSLDVDDDPLMPITAVGCVPTFPATEMHAILTNPALADVVGWAPHGRSWRILKPRDFEIRVLPKYFEHSKFSSFVRQANGWGFRRMSEGYEKNAYYHEYFLRAMPWLCKKMRRPKVAEKKAVDPDMEPDLDAISRQFPVPDRPPSREVLVLQKTIELGPKARMPVLWDTETPSAAPLSPIRGATALREAEDLPSLNITAPPSLNHSSSYADLKPAALPDRSHSAAVSLPAAQAAGRIIAAQPMPVDFAAAAPADAAPPGRSTGVAPSVPLGGGDAAATTAASSDSHFAAGFMAATTYHSIQMRSMLESAFLAGLPPHVAVSMANIAVPPAATNLGNALSLLRAGGTGGAYHVPFPHHAPLLTPRADPRPVAVASVAFNDGGGQRGNNLSEEAMMLRQLQQFQSYQVRGGGVPQFPFPR
ncbi:hypothetical protein ACHAW5_009576 [Stephanodiscus triporus]|uniref:HSF-type DNA-binding domain-containing protein n=1 Tax=Stephanodiscus triporus TaxID=2934178 RepID=A0ABD3NFB8_9STRA